MESGAESIKRSTPSLGGSGVRRAKLESHLGENDYDKDGKGFQDHRGSGR
jgi:hypothetical protein